MNIRHAAALALAGWYLMLPPTQEMVDPICHGRFSLSGLISGLTESASDRLKRCDREALFLVFDAPFLQWVQGGEFETLAECRADQQKPLTQEEKAEAGLTGAFTAGSGVSKDDLMRTLEHAISASKCLASDDPRLKGN
jgi:hypothetical protein